MIKLYSRNNCGFVPVLNTDSVNVTGVVTYPMLTSEGKQPWVLFEIHKIDFRMQCIQVHFVCLLSKQKLLWYLDLGLEHMAARPRGNGTNVDWLR